MRPVEVGLSADPAEVLDAMFSGRPQCALDRTWIAMIGQAFIDESGGPDQQTFLMAGYLDHWQKWKLIANEWKYLLLRYDIEEFHMSECESGRGEFEKLKPEERQALCMDLARCISWHKPIGFCFSVKTSEFRRIVMDDPDVAALLKKGRRHTKATWGHPQGYMLTAMILVLLDLLPAIGQIDYIFDWHDRFKKLLDKHEPWMRGLIQKMHPTLHPGFGQILMPRPEFRHLYAPLQAADLLAWHMRRLDDEPDGADRPVYRELMKIPGFGRYQFTAERLARSMELRKQTDQPWIRELVAEMNAATSSGPASSLSSSTPEASPEA